MTKLLISFFVLLAILMPILASADQDSAIAGNCKVSFDLGLTHDKYHLTVDRPNVAQSSGVNYNRYIINLTDNTEPYFAMIAVDHFSVNQPVASTDEARKMLQADLINRTMIMDASISMRPIDGTQAAYTFADAAIGIVTMKAYMVSYQPTFDPGHYMVSVFSTYPWKQRTSQLLSTIHVELESAATQATNSSTATSQSTSSATKVIDHSMGKDIDQSTNNIISRTTSFSGSDSKVYSWLELGNVGAGKAEWRWYSPNGNPYSTVSFNVPMPSSGASWGTYNIWGYIDLAGSSAASQPGDWHVDVYFNGQKLLTEHFTLLAQKVLQLGTAASSNQGGYYINPTAGTSISVDYGGSLSGSYTITGSGLPMSGQGISIGTSTDSGSQMGTIEDMSGSISTS